MVFSNTMDAPCQSLLGEVESSEVVRAPERRFVRSPQRVRGPSVLAIGLPVDRLIDGVNIRHAASSREVIEMLRVLDVSLLLVSAGAVESEIWKMVQVVRRVWPGLRWVLLSEDCGDQEEILARSLGAASVTADPAVIRELARNRRQGR